jgi:hypothetical protein
MRLVALSYCLLGFLLFSSAGVFAQETPDSIIQINGVTMTADSLRAVPDVTISIKNKNRGVEASYAGVFSLVCYKGDTLEFTCTGFTPKSYAIPKTLKGQYFTLIQLMVQDTFYLPETIIRPLPTKEAFTYAFLHWRIPDDQYELARKNTNSYVMRTLYYTLPGDGHEAQSRVLAEQAKQAMYYGQQQPMNILSPIAWGQFFEAWKRGDFRSSSNPYSSYSNSDY